MKLFVSITSLWVTVSSLTAAVQASTNCNGNANNLMKCFIAAPSLATQYCSSFLSVPIFAITITITTTAVAQTTLPSIVSTETDVLTSTTNLISWSLATSTITATTFTTTTVTAAYVSPAGISIVQNRDSKNPKQSPTSLACLTDIKPQSASASISSAYKCLSVTPLTVSVTVTARISTSTSFTPVTATIQITTNVEDITVLPTTFVTTAQETDIITSTTTSAAPAPPPPCIPGSLATVDSVTFQQFFAGSGVREPTDNPAAYGYAPNITTFPGTLDDCLAGHYQGDGTSYFTISDPDVGYVYGYTN